MKESCSSIKIPSTVPGIGYTLKHHMAVKLLINYHCEKLMGKKLPDGSIFTKKDFSIMKNRAACHDMDKIVCGLAYPQMMVDYFHRMFNGHHEENIMGSMSKYDILEMIMDVESARYTKPDKGLTPWEAFSATGFKNYLGNIVIPYLHVLGFDRNDKSCIPEIKKLCSREVYEADLVKEIVAYMHTTKIHRLEGVARLDDEAYIIANKQIAPFRHKLESKDLSKGTAVQLPTEFMKKAGRWQLNHNLIDGVFHPQVYDYDSLCMIKVADIPKINKEFLSEYFRLIQMRLHR